MIAALLICFIYVVLVWLVFFKFKWIKFSIVWGVVSGWIGLHALLIFMIGLRFMTPYTTEARVIQHTIQLTPRLSEPTLVTAVLVEPGMPVKKGQPLFQFDRRPYEYQAQQLEAQLAAAKQQVQVLGADVNVAEQTLAKTTNEVAFAQYQKQVAENLARTQAGTKEEVEKWTIQLQVDQASVLEAEADVARIKLKYESQINGVNTTVATVQAQLEQARYYLGNTTMVAPEDGRVVNLQVRPGMVAGDYRIGAIASFICDDDRYLLANFNQMELKYVTNGQPVEVALNMYPGQIFPAKVEAIWKANGVGQLLPSGTLPNFEPTPPQKPQGQYAVKIVFDDADQSKFPIGAQGAAAIYTCSLHGGWAAMRRIGIRTYSWLNWLYPMPF
jgi:multidrug resistance efflux pump